MTDDIDALAEEDAAKPPAEDRLLRLRSLVSEARQMEALKAAAEEQLKELNVKLQEMYFKTLPDTFAELKIPGIELEADGDLPAIEARAKPYYRANIAADWPEERRRAAFEYLDNNDSGDLIKTEVILQFPREKREEALRVAEGLRKRGYEPFTKESVMWNTLTAWLKEQVENGTIPDLDKIGGTVGRIVTLKPLKT
jgi:hypothetical protein